MTGPEARPGKRPESGSARRGKRPESESARAGKRPESESARHGGRPESGSARPGKRPESGSARPVSLASFDPAVAQWFGSRFEAPTAPQQRAWPAIAAGRNVLLTAPTSANKGEGIGNGGHDGLSRTRTG